MKGNLTVNNCDIKQLVSDILDIYPNIRESSTYQQLDFAYMEYTMSCDFGEQRAWMTHFIQKSLNNIDLNDLSNELYYKDIISIIVAYDLMVEEKK